MTLCLKKKKKISTIVLRRKKEDKYLINKKQRVQVFYNSLEMFVMSLAKKFSKNILIHDSNQTKDQKARI